MVRANVIENEVRQMDGGAYHNLMDAYFYKKYKCTNLQSLGVQLGTNKSTKGTPDSYTKNRNGKYTLYMYGTVQVVPYSKLKEDIHSCFDPDKLDLPLKNIEKVICAYTSTNLTIEQKEDLENFKPGVDIELVGLDTLAKDLMLNYPFILKDYLNIPLDSGQIFLAKKFIEVHDKTGINAPINTEFKYREKELEILKDNISTNAVNLVTGPAGLGKTRLAIEACLEFESDGWEVFCIKNNGKDLHDDIRRYINQKGKHIIFIDDANSAADLNAVLSYLSQLSTDIDYKVILTIRDYAVEPVKKIVENYYRYTELKVKRLEDKQIKNLIINELNITNHIYLDRILDISKGNPRLANLAGRYALENNLLDLNNTIDIYKKYYGKIIDENTLSDTEVDVLFAIALCGGTVKSNDTFLLNTLEILNVVTNDFTEICRDLNKLELIDMFNDEAVKYADESLKDYILYYKLLDSREFSIKQLMDLGFIQNTEKVIDVLNILIGLFNSEKNTGFIKSEVLECWNSADEKYEELYLRNFHTFDVDKSLEEVNSRVELMDIFNVNFEKNYERSKNNHGIDNLELEVLKSFKRYEVREEAVELLLVLTEKRADLMSEIYNVFTNHMLIDKYSHYKDYEIEYNIMNQVWKSYKDSKDERIMFLLFKLVEYSLQYSYSQYEERPNNNLSVIEVSLIDTKGSREYRKLLWSILKDFYETNNYRDRISDIISFNFEYGGIFGDKQNDLLAYDLKCIDENFINRWEELDTRQCKVLFDLSQFASQMDIKLNDSSKRYRSNKYFKIYVILKGNSDIDFSVEENEMIMNNLKIALKDFSISDYYNLFVLLKGIENQSGEWLMHERLSFILDILESENNIVEGIRMYFDANAPFYFNSVNTIFKNLYENMSVDEVEFMIDESDLVHKRYWLHQMWGTLPEHLVSEKNTLKYIEFFNNEVKFEKPFIHHSSTLTKYVKAAPHIVNEFSDLIIQLDNYKDSAFHFIGRITSEDKVSEILSLFQNNLDVLEGLYLLAHKSKNELDPKGLLLFQLIDRNRKVWNYYLENLFNKSQRSMSANNVFKSVWKHEDYEYFIDILFERMQSTGTWRYDTQLLKNLFPEDSTVERQIDWILGAIEMYSKDEEKVSVAFDIILMRFQEEKKQFYLKFIEHNEDIEHFKLLPFTPKAAIISTGNSFIPYMDNELKFLSDLKRELKGRKYLKHKKYLGEREKYIYNDIQKQKAFEYIND